MKIANPGRYLVFFLFLVLCYFPLFLHLDSLSLRLWDEGRRAVNALEMLHNGNWLVPHYRGEPDMWGTKPPLLVWLQTTFMTLIGPGELAVRLPAALSGLATIGLMLWFAVRHLKQPAVGFLAGLVLVTIPGYLDKHHSVRSGDYDALLTLWLTGTLLFFFLYTEATDKRLGRRFLWLTTGCLILGVLTKGIAGLFFLPGLFVFAIYRRQLSALFSDGTTYWAIGLFLLIVGGYYLLREQLNPGYLAAVWQNELGGRYVEGLEAHQHGFGYYWRRLLFIRMPFWVFFVPLGGFLGWWAGGKRRTLSFLLSANSLIFLLVISFSQTKLAWYDLPVYPSFALLAAIGLVVAHQMLAKRFFRKRGALYYGLMVMVVLLLFSFPYQRALKQVYKIPDRGHQWEKMQYAYFIEAHPEFKNYQIALNEYNPHVQFYLELFNRRGYELSRFGLSQPASPGTRLLTCDPVFREALWELQDGRLRPLVESGACVLWEVR